VLGVAEDRLADASGVIGIPAEAHASAAATPDGYKKGAAGGFGGGPGSAKCRAGLATTMGARLRWGLVVVLVAWIALMGLDPTDRSNWVYGNIPLLVVLPFVLWSFRIPLSDASYLLVFAFLAMHEYGTHYGYQVPWMDGAGARNAFDRLVHVAFGALLVLPVRDALRRTGKADGGWASFLAVALLLAAAALYEVTEWIGALLFYEGPAERFLGHQGDPLDATKDLALALAGSLGAMAVAWPVMRIRAARSRPQGAGR